MKTKTLSLTPKELTPPDHVPAYKREVDDISNANREIEKSIARLQRLEDLINSLPQTVSFNENK